MRDLTDEENEYDYSPNDLSELSLKNPDKYNRIVQSNLKEDDTVEQWEQRNLRYMQRINRNNDPFIY